ncbi:MAG: hypothetical protein ACRCYX_07615 [Dermatophilaceae bacterium]
MKFDMGDATLSTLAKGTAGSTEDLGALVKQLVAAVEPLEGTFNGAGRRAFDAFKARTDEVAVELNTSLGLILQGQGGMDTAFTTGDLEASDNAGQAQGQAAFDAARFSSRA